MQVFVLTLPRHLDLRILVLSIGLAAYLIYIGVRSIVIARHGPEAKFDWGRMFLRLLKLPGAIGRTNLVPSKTSTIPLVALGITQAIAGVLAFLYLGVFILVRAAYLGVGQGALPALAFCLLGTVSGIALVVRRSVGACRAAAVWNLTLALFFVAAAFAGPHSYPEGLIPAAIFLAVFTILIVPMLPCRDRSR